MRKGCGVHELAGMTNTARGPQSHWRSWHYPGVGTNGDEVAQTTEAHEPQPWYSPVDNQEHHCQNVEDASSNVWPRQPSICLGITEIMTTWRTRASAIVQPALIRRIASLPSDPPKTATDSAATATAKTRITGGSLPEQVLSAAGEAGSSSSARLKMSADAGFPYSHPWALVHPSAEEHFCHFGVLDTLGDGLDPERQPELDNGPDDKGVAGPGGPYW